MAKTANKQPLELVDSIGSMIGDAVRQSSHAYVLVDGHSLRILDASEACFSSLRLPFSALLNGRLVDIVDDTESDKVFRAVQRITDGMSLHEQIICTSSVAHGKSKSLRLDLERSPSLADGHLRLLVNVSQDASSAAKEAPIKTALSAANIRVESWIVTPETLRAWQDFDAEITAPPEHSLGAFLSALQSDDKREVIQLLQAVAKGELKNIDTTVRTRGASSGQQRCLHLRCVCPSQEPNTLLALYRDVTDSQPVRQLTEKHQKTLKKTEAKLLRSESELIELLAIVPDFIVRLDQQHAIQYASPSFSRDCRSQTHQLVGTKLLELLAIDAHTAFANGLKKLGASERSHEFVSEETRDGKERYIWWTLIKMEDVGSGDGTLCLGRDISEVSQARRKLEQKAKQLQRSNAALDDFAAVIAHDLQSPMRHIAHFSEFLRTDCTQLSEENAWYLESIRSSVKRLQDMTDNLLNYSRLGLRMQRMEERSLVELVADAIHMLSERMKTSGARVEMGLLPSLVVDPMLIARLFQNLLSNSIKYCEAGIQPEIHVSAERDEDDWIIYWSDCGIGIDASHSERIFKIFSRLHDDESLYAGSGVGLALCKRIVESHGGEIWLDSDYEQGARFVIRLPIQQAAQRGLMTQKQPY